MPSTKKGSRDRVNWSHVFTVMRKEATDTLRDRRSWIAMIVIPLVLIPVLLIVAPSAVENQIEKAAKTIGEVVVVGADQGPDLVALLEETEGINVAESSAPESALENGDIQAILYIPDGFSQALAAEEPVTLRVAFDAADQKSDATHTHLLNILWDYGGSIAEQRLAARGLDPSIVHPLDTSSENVAPPAKMGGLFLSLIMPMMIGVWAALGGMYAAIDGAAGEKERGTLEPLLSAPPSRFSLVLGKFFVVTLMSLVSATVSVGAMLIAFTIKPEALASLGAAGASVTAILPLTNLALLALAALGVAAIFAALQLAVSVYARSFREAQTYLSPLAVMIVLPGIFTQFMPAAEAPRWFFSVPLVNAIFVFKELIGGTVNWSHFGTMMLSSLILAYLCLRFTVSLFNREQVLFRT